MNPLLARCALSLCLTLPLAAQSTFVEEGRLLEPVFEPGSTVGSAVGISAGRIAVGDADPTRAGQVFTYTTSAGLWQHDATAVALDAAVSDRFGAALAIENDTLLVGALRADLPGFFDAGAAYVFTRSGASWVQQQKFTASVPKDQGLFGSAVALSGNTLAIGAPQTDFWSQGEVDVYLRSGSRWSFQQKLVPTGLQNGARAGSSVALQGNRLVIGAPIQAVNGQLQVGQVFVFERAAGTWTQTATLDTPAPISAGTFGASVALDQGRIAVGATGEAISGGFFGRVHVFTGSGSSWTLEQTLIGNGTSTQQCLFGTSLDLDGTRLAVGAPGHYNAQASLAGTVKLFERSGSVWTERLDLFGATASTFDQFGQAVALSGDLVVGGAPNGDVANQSTRGEAYIFRLDPQTPASYCTAKVTSAGCLPSIGWSGTPSASSASPFLISATSVTNRKPGMLIHGKLFNQLPFQGGTLCILGPIRRTSVQNSGGNQGGNDCSGHFSYDFNALIQGGSVSGLEPGKWVYAQYWFRDPLSPIGSGLTDAVRFLIQP